MTQRAGVSPAPTPPEVLEAVTSLARCAGLSSAEITSIDRPVERQAEIMYDVCVKDGLGGYSHGAELELLCRRSVPADRVQVLASMVTRMRRILDEAGPNRSFWLHVPGPLVWAVDIAPPAKAADQAALLAAIVELSANGSIETTYFCPSNLCKPPRIVAGETAFHVVVRKRLQDGKLSRALRGRARRSAEAHRVLPYGRVSTRITAARLP